MRGTFLTVALCLAFPALAVEETGDTGADVIIPAGEGEGETGRRPAELPAATPPSTSLSQEEAPPRINAVRLQGLNKVTARVSTIEATLGGAVRFGNLEIIPRRCWQAPPEAQPENAAYLEIREWRPDEAPATIFNGWMFSSSPALSGLEHPVYDITVQRCVEMKEE